MSERHLANLEYGVGNASILILLQVAQALQCALAELVGDFTTQSLEWLMLREMLAGPGRGHACAGCASRRPNGSSARRHAGPEAAVRSSRIALIGLRGAGKSTLGRMLAEDLDFPFVELSREIEMLAGCSISEILGLYGQNAYRRYERRALEEAIDAHPEAVIATAGGLVSDLSSFNLLLRRCTTVWLKAEPEDHMSRVAAQGDLRPMAASREAMEDLKTILASRAAFYSKADLHVDTSAQPLIETLQVLRVGRLEGAGSRIGDLASPWRPPAKLGGVSAAHPGIPRRLRLRSLLRPRKAARAERAPLRRKSARRHA